MRDLPLWLPPRSLSLSSQPAALNAPAWTLSYLWGASCWTRTAVAPLLPRCSSAGQMPCSTPLMGSLQTCCGLLADRGRLCWCTVASAAEVDALP